MGSQEKMWQHVEQKGLNKKDSSSEQMLIALESPKTDVQVTLGEISSEIKKLGSVTTQQQKMELANLKNIRKKFEDELKDIFEQEIMTPYFDNVAGERPEDTLISDAGGRRKPKDINLDLN